MTGMVVFGERLIFPRLTLLYRVYYHRSDITSERLHRVVHTVVDEQVFESVMEKEVRETEQAE